jgi:hypothetical protein
MIKWHGFLTAFTVPCTQVCSSSSVVLQSFQVSQVIPVSLVSKRKVNFQVSPVIPVSLVCKEKSQFPSQHSCSEFFEDVKKKSIFKSVQSFQFIQGCQKKVKLICSRLCYLCFENVQAFFDVDGQSLFSYFTRITSKWI